MAALAQHVLLLWLDALFVLLAVTVYHAILAIF
jgi:hypothetical protein